MNELKQYFNILCNNNYPKFIDKYLETEELKRLKGIGQFCGCDYTNIYNIKYWYSRFDHSIAVALITWNFSKSKEQTLTALFHDLGTPAFSHSIDFYLNDSINQGSSELNVEKILKNSKSIKKLLKEDNIDIEQVIDYSKYPIIKNKIPGLCADRLDGVLHTIYIWLNKWNLNDIKNVYENIIVLNNELDEEEIAFKNIEIAERFYEAVQTYSIELQSNEDKYILSYIASCVKKLIDNKIISFNDLYILSEQDIIKYFKNNIQSWDLFTKSSSIKRTDKKQKEYSVSIDSKKRNVIPLCLNNNEVIRIDKCSLKVKKLLNEYNNFKDSKYCYIENVY